MNGNIKADTWQANEKLKKKRYINLELKPAINKIGKIKYNIWMKRLEKKIKER